MPIIDETHSARIEVDVPCLVHCTNCDCQFVYERKFSGSGVAHTSLPNNAARTRKAAEEKARKDLAEMLSNHTIHDPVPCPRCFHYQTYMFTQVGYRRYDDMGCVVYLLEFLGPVVSLGGIAYAVFVSGAVIAYGLIAVGIVMHVIGRVMERRMHRLVEQFNPNADSPLAERQRIAGARAFPLPDYDARQAGRVGELYRRHRADSAADPLVAEWWLPPSVFHNGGQFWVVFPDGERFAVQVRDDANPGDVIDPTPARPHTEAFRLRLLEMRVHPDELRLE